MVMNRRYTTHSRGLPLADQQPGGVLVISNYCAPVQSH